MFDGVDFIGKSSMIHILVCIVSAKEQRLLGWCPKSVGRFELRQLKRSFKINSHFMSQFNVNVSCCNVAVIQRYMQFHLMISSCNNFYLSHHQHFNTNQRLSITHIWRTKDTKCPLIAPHKFSHESDLFLVASLIIIIHIFYMHESTRIIRVCGITGNHAGGVQDFGQRCLRVGSTLSCVGVYLHLTVDCILFQRPPILKERLWIYSVMWFVRRREDEE